MTPPDGNKNVKTQKINILGKTKNKSVRGQNVGNDDSSDNDDW